MEKQVTQNYDPLEGIKYKAVRQPEERSSPAFTFYDDASSWAVADMYANGVGDYEIIKSSPQGQEPWTTVGGVWGKDNPNSRTGQTHYEIDMEAEES